MIEMWNKRYSAPEYAYGTEPNQFFKETLDQLDLQGSILLPAEGEGRNAVFAAQRGLKVSGFDISIEGQKKAMKLAKRAGVQIRYAVGIFEKMDQYDEKFDHAALIYAHFPPNIRSTYYRHIGNQIHSGGYVILEGFSKTHLEYREKNPNVGGPGTVEMLLSKEEILESFPDFQPILLEDVEATLMEGLYHKGKGKVIRFIGQKK